MTGKGELPPEAYCDTGPDRMLLLHRMTGWPIDGHDDSAGSRQNLILTYAADTIARTAPTPVVEITATVNGVARTILLKLDGFSRWGSIKGRTALALLVAVAARIGDRTMIVESTSGNLGVALSSICRDLGIPFTAVVDRDLPPAMHARMSAHGAQIVEVPGANDGRHLQRRIARVQEILREDADAVWTNQYENRANADVHRWWTGPELGRQISPRIQALFVPISTGGSFAGLREYLAADHPGVECTAVDVHGSTIFGGTLAPRLLTGIGASRQSTFLPTNSMPPHVLVSAAEAIATCRALQHDIGIGVGGSSGATLAGCLRYLSKRPELTYAACLCPDMAANYAETLYDDSWLRRAGFDLPLRRTFINCNEIRFVRSHTAEHFQAP